MKNTESIHNKTKQTKEQQPHKRRHTMIALELTAVVDWRSPQYADELIVKIQNSVPPANTLKS